MIYILFAGRLERHATVAGSSTSPSNAEAASRNRAQLRSILRAVRSFEREPRDPVDTDASHIPFHGAKGVRTRATPGSAPIRARGPSPQAVLDWEDPCGRRPRMQLIAGSETILAGLERADTR
ncbi:hypothetical protein CDD83_4958 [Cordyceps sp. RAO-2017]|nr:hypothetical protein CDD83_4958 [Cordyceps sp. RAO-2017]